jgi:hypothetical protein
LSADFAHFEPLFRSISRYWMTQLPQKHVVIGAKSEKQLKYSPFLIHFRELYRVKGGSN